MKLVLYNNFQLGVLKEEKVLDVKGVDAFYDWIHDSIRDGEPVDAGAPLLPEQEQNRRDQRAGVSDANPEDKVDDGPSPANRIVVTPDTNTRRDQVGDALVKDPSGFLCRMFQRVLSPES